MDTVLASLGLGTRYCLVSDDHERPEPGAEDEHCRGPQSLLERCSELGSGHERLLSSRPPPATASASASPGSRGLLGRLRPDRDREERRAGKRERLVTRADRQEEREKENAGPVKPERSESGPGLFERLTARGGDGRLGGFGGRRAGHRSDQGSAPLMTGDSADSWGWNTSPKKSSADKEKDSHWGSGAAWDDAQLVAPKTKAAKARSSAKKTATSDQASLIDLGDNKEDEWQSWEDDAWASLERKN